MKVLVATEKPFAAVAVNGIKEILDNAGVEMVLLEKYPDKAALLKAVEDVEGLIVRSDIVDAEVFDAAPKLKIVVLPELVMTISTSTRLLPKEYV